MKTKRNAGGDFNGIAPFYDMLAFVVFGRQLQQAQLAFLNRIPAGASILLVGGGTGWLLEQLLIQCRPKRVVYLEPSAQMIARASRRILHHGVVGAVDFRVGDESTLLPDEQFDLIITPFVLDLFTEPTLQTTFIPRLRNALQTDGLWLVTDFVRPAVGWQKELLWIMIRFFRLTAGIQAKQLADWQQVMAESELRREAGQRRVGGMVSTEVWRKRL